MKPVTLTWNPVTLDAQGAPMVGPITYKIYAALTGASYGAPLATTSSTSDVVSMPTVGAYKAVVTASGVDGDSAQSNQVNFTSSLQLPAAPTGLVVS